MNFTSQLNATGRWVIFCFVSIKLYTAHIPTLRSLNMMEFNMFLREHLKHEPGRHFRQSDCSFFMHHNDIHGLSMLIALHYAMHTTERRKRVKSQKCFFRGQLTLINLHYARAFLPCARSFCVGNCRARFEYISISQLAKLVCLSHSKCVQQKKRVQDIKNSSKANKRRQNPSSDLD